MKKEIKSQYIYIHGKICIMKERPKEGGLYIYIEEDLHLPLIIFPYTATGRT
jgi:hypothetical protein